MGGVKNRDFDPLDPLPANFLDALNEFISTAAPNFAVQIKPTDATVLQVVAGPGNDQVGIGIEGRWRYNTATVERASPGGSTRTLDLYVTGTDNVFVPGDPGEIDNTDYAFGLSIVEHGALPAGVAISRLVATAVWNGTVFTTVDVLVGAQSGTARHAATHRTGASDEIPEIPTAGQKAAMAGSSGAPAEGNRYVTELDPRISGLSGSSNVVFVATVGDGVASAFAIDHNLGTRSIEVQVRQTNTPFAVVEPDIEFTTINQVTVRFTPTVPGVGEYTVTIMAPGTAIQTVLPSGIIMPFVSAAAPTGWLLCDGASYLRATYPALFAALGGSGSPYGLPDGTHFNVPDLRDRVAVGKSGTIGLGASGGEKTHALTTAELASHTHGVTDPGHYHSARFGNYFIIGPSGGDAASAVAESGGGSQGDSITATSTTGVSVNSTGSGGAHNNMQPYLGLNYLVKI